MNTSVPFNNFPRLRPMIRKVGTIVDREEIKEVKEHFKKGYEAFSIGTSFHGFAELYQAKSSFWIIIWSVVLIGAFGLTAYQVHNAVMQYVDEPTITSILPAKEENIMYPPFRICYQTWLFWLDWKKAAEMNISKETLLYGLTYINVVYSSNVFNFTKTKVTFDRMMKERNYSTIFDFFKGIARKVPIVGDNHFETYFDEIEFVLLDTVYVFCYTISSRQIKKYFADNSYLTDVGSAGKVITFTSTDETYNMVADYITPQEYSQTMIRWVHYKSLYTVWPNLTGELLLLNFSAPVVIYPNAYNPKTLNIFSENDDYSIKLDATVRKLKNTESNICLEDESSFSDDNNCRTKCSAIFQKSSCSCLSLHFASILNDNQTDKICRRDLNLIVKNETRALPFGDLSFDHVVCTPTVESTLQYERCKNECIPPCSVWNYDVTTSFTRMALAVRYISTKISTNISIKYPASTDIVSMTEINAVTFDSFVSSVGGLLGIWTGASIVSFFQLIYLFCCANGETKYCVPRLKVKPSLVLKQTKVFDIEAQ